MFSIRRKKLKLANKPEGERIILIKAVLFLEKFKLNTFFKMEEAR